MVSNVNPTDPKFIDENDLDTEGHRVIPFVSPTEQDTAGLRDASADEGGDGIMARADEGDDTDGHLMRL